MVLCHPSRWFGRIYPRWREEADGEDCYSGTGGTSNIEPATTNIQYPMKAQGRMTLPRVAQAGSLLFRGLAIRGA
jgi:hypothetical protein